MSPTMSSRWTYTRKHEKKDLFQRGSIVNRFSWCHLYCSTIMPLVISFCYLPFFLSSMVLIKHQWLLFLNWCPKRGNRNKHTKQAWSRSKKSSNSLPCNVWNSAFGIHVHRDLDTSCPKRNMIILNISEEICLSWTSNIKQYIIWKHWNNFVKYSNWNIP